jgi:ubiquinone/menaquinone biosynthesis C-methylase UbiE
MSVRYHSQTVRRETLHTISVLAPHLRPGMSILDVGCGEGYVTGELAARVGGDMHGADIVDIRRHRGGAFSRYDGLHLPFAEDRFDLVLLSFVLHHVPDERKLALLHESLRVSRDKVLIIEDTPTTALDRFFNHRHGEAYRRKIDSAAPFGFLSPREWRWLFRGMGVSAESRPLGRFCRSILQPYARTAFVLHKPARAVAPGPRPVEVSPPG